MFRKYKLLVNVLVGFFSIFPYSFNLALFRSLRNAGGRLGMLVRYVLAKNLCAYVGDNVSIHPGVFMFSLSNIALGSNVSIHPMCYIEGSGGIVIGDDVSIAHSSSVLSTDHSWGDASAPIKYNDIIPAPVVIKEDVWLGCGSRVMSGVVIHSRSVVAAGAVVASDVPFGSLVGGVPARVIKTISS